MKVVIKESKLGLIKNRVYEMRQDDRSVLFKLKTRIVRVPMELVSRIKLEEYDAA